MTLLAPEPPPRPPRAGQSTAGLTPAELLTSAATTREITPATFGSRAHRHRGRGRRQRRQTGAEGRGRVWRRLGFPLASREE
jgi:hypothetical protein